MTNLLRRSALRVGGIGGLGLASFFRAQRLAASSIDPAAKSCIMIWLAGGPSHLETFDPKPEAPSEVRGPMGVVDTNVAGIQLNECFEQTAKVMDQVALVRSVTSPLGEHNFGSHYLMTGYRPSPALVYPTLGATISAHRQQLEREASVLPPYIAVPRLADTGDPASGNGYLPASHGAFAVGGNPSEQDFEVKDLDFYHGVDLPRTLRRKQFVEALNRFQHGQESEVSNPDLERAYRLIASQEAKEAFELSDESDGTRARYGRGGGNGIGQSCLLARRLVERGVPFVTVTSTGWDTHQDIKQLKSRFANDRNAHLPSLDRALGALISDLDERSMLHETLVVVMGEFGRTPKLNTSGGRDHWPNVFSVAMAGGGIRGGQVVGSSDKLAEFPFENPVTPSDLAATIYHQLGVNPAATLKTEDGRPVRITPDGASVVHELLASRN